MPAYQPARSTRVPKAGDQPDPLSEKLLDGQDILQLFHISVRTLQHWRSRGILPYSKIGNKIYYRQRDVDEMLEKNRRVR